MKNTVIAVMTLIMTGAAQAAIPQLNYECPGQIQFHSDEGGPVYINGQEAKVKGRCEQVPDMRSCLSSGAMKKGSS
ncbi:hypothetical protein ACK31W_19540 [Aeromonas caviae]